MSEKDNIKGLLDGMKKDPGFEVPKNYFEDFPARLQHKLDLEQAEKKDSGKEKTLFYILKPYMSFAAMFIGFAIIIYTGYKSILNQSPDEAGIMTPMAATEMYENIEVTEYELLDMITEEDLIAMEASSESDQIIDYLVGQNIDIYTLVDEIYTE